jgi:hypothetical protein
MITTILRIFAFFLIFICSTASNAQRLPVERSLNDKEWGYQIMNVSPRAGLEFQKFELRDGDCGRDDNWNDCEQDRIRTEVALTQHWSYKNDVWIGFSLFIPRNFPTAKPWTTIAQIHQCCNTGLPDGLGGMKRPPHMQIMFTKGKIEIVVWSLAGSKAEPKTYPVGQISSFANRWIDVQIHFDTKNSNGNLEVFFDKKQIVNLRDTVTQVPNYYYFKYGIYISGVSEWGGRVPTQRLYFDEVRFGYKREEVDPNNKPPMD